jgi:hypothetical protein
MRLQTRPTWLAVLVGTATGFCIGRPGLILSAFREDGLPFVVFAFALVGVILAAWRDTRRQA